MLERAPEIVENSSRSLPGSAGQLRDDTGASFN